MTSTITLPPPPYANLPERAVIYIPYVEEALKLCVAGGGEEPTLDAYLVFGVIDRESRCGDALTPKGPTGTGDEGFGRGLMQIDSRPHKGDFLDANGLRNCEWIKLIDGAGTPLWQKPRDNIERGVWCLRQALNALGDVCAAVAAYNCGVERAREVMAAIAGAATSTDAKARALDKWCTGGDYVSDVLRRRAKFLPTR